MDKKICKNIMFILFYSFVFVMLFRFFYFTSYNFINHLNPQIYSNYASDNQFDSNIFFYSDNDEENEVINNFKENLLNLDDIINAKRQQDLAGVLLENVEEVRKIAHNTLYNEYLQSKELTFDHFIKYQEKIYRLDENLISFSLYITFIIIAICMIYLSKLRVSFYVLTGTVYLLSMMSMLTDGMFNYIFMDIINHIAQFTNNEPSNITDVNMLFNNIIPELKESFLTFIIFETIVQNLIDNKNDEYNQKIRNFIYSLDVQIRYLEQQNDKPKFNYMPKFNFPVKELKKMIILQKRKNKKNKYKIEKILKFEAILKSIFQEKKSYTLDEHINLLHEIRMLLYEIEFKY